MRKASRGLYLIRNPTNRTTARDTGWVFNMDRNSGRMMHSIDLRMEGKSFLYKGYYYQHQSIITLKVRS